MIRPPDAFLADLFKQIGDELLSVDVDPIEDRVRALQEAREKKDVLGWLRAGMPRTYRLAFNPMHEYLVSTMYEPESGLESPRSSAKTAVGCAGVTLYQALEEPEQYDYVMNVQGTEPKALAINLGIRLEVEQNEVLRAVYGDQVGPDKWTDGLFVLKNGVVFHAVSTGQRLRGTNYRLRRPNLVVLDDAYEDDDINNPESTQKKNDWIESTLQPMMAQDRPTIYRFQGTAINDVDGLIKMEASSKQPGSRVKFARFCAFGEFDANGTWFDSKKVLWPEQRSYDAWLAKRDAPGTNPTIFAREYLNERRDESSAIVKPSWLKPSPTSKGWEFDPSTLRFDRDHRLLAVMLLVDPSIGKDKESDCTAMGVLIKSIMLDAKAADYWLMAAINERLTLHERILAMQKMIDNQPKLQRITKARVEAVAGFKDFAAEARRRLRGCGVEEVDVVKDKISVLESKSWHFQNGKVHVSTAIPAPVRQELYNQMTVNYPIHDDLRDMLLLGLDGGVTSWGDFL